MARRVASVTLLLAVSLAPAAGAPIDRLPARFEKQRQNYPVLDADPAVTFDCPVSGEAVAWQEAYVFNPAAIVVDGAVRLLFRAEDNRGRYGGTSRIGLAESEDGLTFKKRPEPVLFADQDDLLVYERGGGVEDPRVVQADNGTFVMTYTAFDGEIARLCVATSTDLVNWKKHGLAFGKADGGRYRDLWSKSGAVITRWDGDRFVAARIDGKYWMYWGESSLFVATSTDLINWAPVYRERRIGKRFTGYLGEGRYQVDHGSKQRHLAAALSPRQWAFDSGLVEPGPPPILTKEGVWVVYNAANAGGRGADGFSDGEYAIGYAVFDHRDPTIVTQRCRGHVLRAASEVERRGQLANAAFTEALVFHRGRWLMYYVTGEANIGVAVGVAD